VFFSGCLRIRMVFSLSFLFFLSFFFIFLFYFFGILTKLSQGFFTLIHCCWMPFTVGCFFFYNAILGFLGYHWSPPFAALGIRTNVVLATLVAASFLILHYFPLLRFPLQKPLANFPILGGLRGLTFYPSFSKASRFQFFRSTFCCFPFCHFS